MNEAGSQDDQPLPIVILGTHENSQRVYRALVEATIRKSEIGRPIQVMAIYSEGVLAICDQIAAKDSKPDQGVTRWAKTFFENCLAIANEMQVDCGSEDLPQSMRWLQKFAEYCCIDHAVMAVPTENDPESEELLCEAAKIFGHVLLIPQVENDEVAVHSYSPKKNSLTPHAVKSGGQKPRRAKELFDIASAIMLGLLGVLFFIFVSLSICIDSHGSITGIMKSLQ